MILLACALLTLYYAYRYAKAEVDPDWAYFNLYTFTGAIYGRDFPDCKMPTIHIYYALLGKVLGTSVQAIRFAHHIIISLPAFLLGGWGAIAYVVLINSGWALAFHGNVGQPAAGLILLALLSENPWLAAVLLVFAILFEPKLAPSALLVSLIGGYFLPFLLVGAAIAAPVVATIRVAPEVWGWLWEANVTLPRRMIEMRKKVTGVIPKLYSMTGYLYFMPWAIIGLGSRPDVLFWLPPLAYLAVISMGGIVRPNHLLPFAPWIALSLGPEAVAALLLTDLCASGFYRGDLWDRFYPGLRGTNKDAREVGEWLRGQEGDLWVNAYHSAVYIYSRKPPVFGMTEQLEIRENLPERREKWRTLFKAKPPKLVVTGPGAGWQFNGVGYGKVAESKEFKVFSRP